MKAFRILVVTAALISALTLYGCDSPAFPVSRHIDDLSLTEVWHLVVDVIDIQKESARLDTFNLVTGADGEVKRLAMGFYGYDAEDNPRYFSAALNSEGLLRVNTLITTAVLEYRHPSGILAELDALGIAALEPGDDGLAIQIRFQRNEISYSAASLDIFHLSGGELRQLETVRLSSKYYSCIIEYFRLQKSDAGIYTTPPMSVSPGERTGQHWFLTEDLSRATHVVYWDGG